MYLLNNPWFIGIGGGILSGLIVAFVSRFIFSRRDRREYLQRVTLANNDVLYAIRPGISEGCIPPAEIIRSMISATARKYGVDESSMYNLDDIASELIKEVMDSSFISANVKKDFCQMLCTIREPEHGDALTSSESELEVSNRYRRQLVFTTSTLVGSLTTVLVFVFSKSGKVFAKPEHIILLAVPAVVAVLAAIVSVIFRDIERLRLRSMDINLGPIRAELSGSRDKEEQKPR